MKIAYFAHVTVPSRRAYAINAMHMCEALNDYSNAEIICIQGTEFNNEKIHAFYDIKNDVKINTIKVFKIKFIESLHFAVVGYFKYIFFKKFSIIYSRDIFSCFFALFMGYRSVFEAHMPIKKIYQKILFRLCLRFKKFRAVFITESLRNIYILEYGDILKCDNLSTILPDGARNKGKTTSFSLTTETIQNRNPVLGYVGNLYPGKGMEIIVPLGKILENLSIHIIGGREEDISYWKPKCGPNIKFFGFVDQKQLPELYKAFDIGLMPLQRSVSPDGSHADIGDVTSPMKLFEYFAYQKLVVSSSLPVLKEVLRHNENSIIVDQNDALAWSDAIKMVWSDKHLFNKIIKTAHYELRTCYAWNKRAQKFLKWMS